MNKSVIEYAGRLAAAKAAKKAADEKPADDAGEGGGDEECQPKKFKK